MATYLDRILAAHRAAAAADRRDPDELLTAAAGMAPARGFAAALRERDTVAVISEIKRRSPSKGDLAPGLVPADMARAYQSGGAAALSVLTDADFFGGSVADLQEACAAVTLPVLRKDFTVGPADVLDARLMGADAVLLIAAALDAATLTELLGWAGRAGLDALVEVHDETEASVALDAGATMVGVNQRDLYTFEVDTGRAGRVASILPDAVIRVAESGIRDGDDVRRLADAGFDAVLVGETLVRAADPAGAVADLCVARART
ncbi:MAG TPA: indole-3-glycerol phosphate synthase TrpC [Acidimicrobiales bacterium]|nr:indole-3-glycerol phosphate synthase TrpC [Acidimicrobiales bacterium]